MLFPYPWFLVPLSFGTLHICVSRIVNFPKTTNLFLGPTKTIRKPSGELPLSSGERCSTANTCILDEGLGFTSSTAGLPDISPERNEQECKHAKLNIHARNKKNTTSCSFFNFRHETKPKKISFKTLTLVSLPSKSNVGWKRIYFFEAGPTVSGDSDNSPGISPTWNFFGFVVFRKMEGTKTQNALL